jgi:2-iminobutanoate/2-iminopropanoate deaminase
VSGQERTAIGVDAKEPYSKAIRAGGFVHVKSQIGWDPETQQIADGIGEQTRLALGNIAKALDAAGATVAGLVKVNVYLAHIDEDFEGMGEAYAAFFQEHAIVETPARTTVGVPLSWPELRIQVDAVALAEGAGSVTP